MWDHGEGLEVENTGITPCLCVLALLSVVNHDGDVRGL